MAALNETRNAIHATAGLAGQGLLLMYHADGVKLCSDDEQAPIGVTAAESSRDAAGALEGSGVGTVAVYPMSGILYILAEVKTSAKFGMPLYVDGGGTGYVAWAAVDGSSVKVGYYMGENKDIAAGDLVPVGVA
tara:strand:+ start:1289 stop:1690 length:402 start_codon:yes stop_codon:yes gene_type:complete